MSQRSFEKRTPLKTEFPAAVEGIGAGSGMRARRPESGATTSGQPELLVAAREPDLIDMHDVLSKTGLSRSSIYRAIRKCGFPPAVPMIGRRQLFVRREVEDWVSAQIAKRKAAAPP